MEILGLLLATLVGLSLGLLGGGGSILTVPIFVYVLDFNTKDAIAMSLAVVGITSLFGAAGHWRAGNVNLRVALIFGAVAMVGAFAGARLSIYVSGAVQLILFSIIMLAAAFSMLRKRRTVGDRAAQADHEPVHLPLAHIFLQAMVVGAVTGLVGVGGGFLIVPALVLLGGLPMKQAIGTSLLVIAMNSVSGFVGYLDQVEIAWGMLAAFTAIAITGILAGSFLVRYVSQEALRRSFAVFLMVMGIFILFQNRGVLMLG